MESALRAQRRRASHGRRPPRARWSRAEREGLASHGASRIPQYCAAPAQWPRDRRADARGGARFARGVPRRCARRPRLRRLRARGCAKRSGARGDYGVAFVAVTNSNHFGVAALPSRADRRRGPRRPRDQQLARGDAGVGRQARALRHQPDRRDLSRGATSPPLVDRPVAVRGRARQDHGGGARGQADSRGLGARRGRPPHDRRAGGARGQHAARRRREGRDARAHRRAARVRALGRARSASRPTASSPTRGGPRASARRSSRSIPSALAGDDGVPRARGNARSPR